MPLEQGDQLFNTLLVNYYNAADNAVKSLGEFCGLRLEPDLVTQLVEFALDPIQEMLEGAMIIDEDLLPIKCEVNVGDDQDGDSEVSIILPMHFEVNPEDHNLRLVQYQDGELVNITDWHGYNPDEDASHCIADALEDMAQIVRRKRDLSIKKDE